MAILNKDEYFNRLHAMTGDDASDETIAFIEDMTDTYNDMENRINNDSNVDWEKKYHELDENWKKKYRHRFFSGESNLPSEDKIDDTYKPETVMVEDLFKEV